MCSIAVHQFTLLDTIVSELSSSFKWAWLVAHRGMPVADEVTEATDVVVVGGELMFVLPDGVRLATG